MTSLRQQACTRARALVAVATSATTTDYTAKVTAMRACHLLATYRVLADVGERLALERACEALIRLLECLCAGCEHAQPGHVCGHCAAVAHGAVVAAKKTMRGKDRSCRE